MEADRCGYYSDTDTANAEIDHGSRAGRLGEGGVRLAIGRKLEHLDAEPELLGQHRRQRLAHIIARIVRVGRGQFAVEVDGWVEMVKRCLACRSAARRRRVGCSGDGYRQRVASAVVRCLSGDAQKLVQPIGDQHSALL